MRQKVIPTLLAGMFLTLAPCGARAGKDVEPSCRDMAGDYRVAETLISSKMLPLAKGILEEVGKPSSHDGEQPPDDSVLSIRHANGVFTLSTHDRSDTAKILDDHQPGQPCRLQFESDPSIWITHTDPRAMSGEQMEHLAAVLSYQWMREVTPEQARSIQYFLAMSFHLEGVISGTLLVPLEKIGEHAFPPP
ncbi:MAG: hypothetical protein LBB51_05785 [Zoogloeaceae bacterium]|jgi:hypothetical protein|nr:hypothetical protein [Zoogloeaceae bacterium]